LKPATVGGGGVSDRGLVSPENESARLRPTEAAIRAWRAGMSDEKVTTDGGAEAESPAEFPPAVPLKRPPVNVAVRKLVPPPPARDENLIVPPKASWLIMVPVWVAVAPLVKGVVKVSKATTEGGAPPNPIRTGTEPAVLPGPVVERVVTPVPATADIGVVFVACCANCRIVSALAEVAIASAANPVIANRVSLERMVLLLPL
jgi:hypothetical protein